MCAISCERFFKGTFLNFNFGLSEINFVNSNKELVTIHEEKMKKLLIILDHENLCTKQVEQQEKNQQ